jgi:hypothetical protein
MNASKGGVSNDFARISLALLTDKERNDPPEVVLRSCAPSC